METVKITLTNGDTKEFPKNTTYYEISKGFNLKKDILGVKKNNEFFGLNEKAGEDATISFIDLNW